MAAVTAAVINRRIAFGETRFGQRMPRVTSLDGKVYELDEATLAKYQISDEEVQKLGLMPALPEPPAVPRPVSGAAQQAFVRLRRGPGGSTLIDIRPSRT
jgi:hypothetical protein